MAASAQSGAALTFNGPYNKMVEHDLEAPETSPGPGEVPPAPPEGPLVGEKRTSHAITEEYAKADPVYVAKTSALPQKYSHYRPILGDGNCGWRATGFSYFETLLALRNSALLEKEIARLTSLNNLIKTVGGVEEWLLEDFVAETISLLRDLVTTMQSSPDAAEQLLLQRFNNPEVSNAIIYHLRMLASAWLKGNAAIYQDFIHGHLGVEEYCKEWLDAPNQEIDHLGIMLLIDVLLKPVGFAVEILYLDRSAGSQVNSHMFQDKEDFVLTNPRGPIIHLLYRPSHYDILYQDPSAPLPLQQQEQGGRFLTPDETTEMKGTKGNASSFRPSKYEWEAAADWQEPVVFQTSTFKNSHYNAARYNTAHYNNPNFQPEEWSPEGRFLTPDEITETKETKGNTKGENEGNPTTGALPQTLEGHSNVVTAVAFSPDGRQLASASEDKTISLWDPMMAPVAQTLEGTSKYQFLQTQRSADEVEHDNAKESIEPRVRLQGPFSDSGFASMPSSAAPSISNDVGQASIHDNHNTKQFSASSSDQGDNKTPENEHTLGAGIPEAADEDLQSVVSDRDEISSQISTRKTQQEVLAESHLSVLLAQHEDLKPLYEIALGLMEKERFVNNFRRILKRYYLDLFQSANTNLERATVHLLRSRWSRVRVAQDIVDRVSPESDELYAQLLDDTRDIEDKIPTLESWIAGNPGLVLPLEPQDIEDEVEIRADDLDDAASDSDQEEEDQDDRSSLLPNVAEMESFLLQGNSFRSLVTNTYLFLLPAALTPLSRVLMTIPYDRLYFSSEDNLSVLNRVKGFAEDHTEENWNWWPLQPRMRPLAKDQTRVYWKCHCGSTQWAEISLSQAESYRLLLQRNRPTLQNNHLCRIRRKNSWRATLKEIITKIVGPVSTRAQLLATQGIIQSVGPQNIQLKPSGGGVRQAANISHNPAGPATINQSGVQLNVGDLSRAELYVLFGIKGLRRTLELEQIQVKEHSDDNAFFQSLTQAYRKHRGFWRYWFSIWQLSHCDFVKFIKLRANRIIHHSKSLPEDITYEYRPRPPAAENPPILPHEFELAFSACSSKCLLSALHDCVEPPTGTFAVERVPKRKGRIEIYSNNLEFAWGIQAQHAISFLRIVLYHILIFASTFGFWAWWLATHPNDLQNAAVPLTTVAVFLSLFWSSAGLLKVSREQD